mmetsp:Transcript_90927/g.199162  ORF Transcript_90927/g.199162 Transcript_90927/m.199162 type:complete len:217 (+) Transcript_90927:304-954(+)
MPPTSAQSNRYSSAHSSSLLLKPVKTANCCKSFSPTVPCSGVPPVATRWSKMTLCSSGRPDGSGAAAAAAAAAAASTSTGARATAFGDAAAGLEAAGTAAWTVGAANAAGAGSAEDDAAAAATNAGPSSRSLLRSSSVQYQPLSEESLTIVVKRAISGADPLGPTTARYSSFHSASVPLKPRASANRRNSVSLSLPSLSASMNWKTSRTIFIRSGA